MFPKRPISIILVVVYVAVQCYSCSGNDIANPSDRAIDDERAVENTNTIEQTSKYKIDETIIINPGELHNQILQTMNRNHIFSKGTKIDKSKYIDMLVMSSNAVFDQNGIEYSVSHEDVDQVLQCLNQWKETGVFDAYKPINERSTDDIYRLMDYIIVQTDIYNAQEINKIRSVFYQLEAIGLDNCDADVIARLVNENSSRDANSESYVSLSILQHSYEFWSNTNIYIPDQRTIAVVPNETDMTIYGIDWWSINILLWDAVGALLCWPLGPVSVICAVVASSAYIAATTKDK